MGGVLPYRKDDTLQIVDCGSRGHETPVLGPHRNRHLSGLSGNRAEIHTVMVRDKDGGTVGMRGRDTFERAAKLNRRQTTEWGKERREVYLQSKAGSERALNWRRAARTIPERIEENEGIIREWLNWRRMNKRWKWVEERFARFSVHSESIAPCALIFFDPWTVRPWFEPWTLLWMFCLYCCLFNSRFSDEWYTICFEIYFLLH